jgi:D-xylose transport system permease protein
MSEATTTPSAAEGQATGGGSQGGRSVRSVLSALELDTRLLGMIVALAVIWVFFNILSGGNFITPRNLWNLSVQSSSIAIMATGMVLIIVSRNIDLSVGSMLGLIGYIMAMIQVIWLPQVFGVSYHEPWIWVVALGAGIAIGAGIGAISGTIIAYLGVPSFIVTLGGLLVWRGLIFRFQQGQTLAPLNDIFALLGGGPKGSLGDTFSWILGGLICLGIIYTLWAGRRRKRRYGFPARPLWAEVLVGVIGCAAVLATVYLANSYTWPPNLAAQWAKETGNAIPPGGIPTGIAIPVVVMLLVGLVMTYLATRRRFGRYVYAIGGNPDAAELGGINVRATIMKTFVLMGVLAAISAAVQTARLNSAVTNLGVQNELDVIAAAVIGGTSFAGGIGTIPGAILGAVVMQSLRSGMLLLNVDSPTQDVVVGIVLVAAVGFDSYLRRRAG